MRILAIGDVVGPCGRSLLERKLWNIRKTMGIDMVVANGENASSGNGLLPGDADALFLSGVDVITSGNHIWNRREIYAYLDEKPHVIRPANYPERSPGAGYCLFDTGAARVLVINLLGNVFIGALDDPFDTADAILAKGIEADVILVDIHAEATSEKKALACYLDGRVSAVFGTHTHVQTNDAQILAGGTGYLTDLGMTGATDSILGVKKEIVIEKFRSRLPVRFQQAEGEAEIQGLLLDVNEKTGTCRSAEVLRLS